MTGAWTTKTRSSGLWSHVNTYVNSYSTVNDIDSNEPWLKRWNELVTVHNILKKKRDFEFIAYVITGNPEASIVDCIQHLFTFIPFLDQHINIYAISINGNIQYSYNEDTTQPAIPEDKEQTIDKNRFASLKSDEESIEENELDDILNSTSPPPPDNDVYSQALDTATSTLKKLSDYTGNETDPNDTSIENYKTNLESINKLFLDAHQKQLEEMNTDYTANIERVTDDLFNTYREKCEKYHNTKLNNFTSYVTNNLQELSEELDTKLSDLDSKLRAIESKINLLQSPYKPQVSTYQKPSPSPTRSSNTPVKQFGATKTPMNTTPIQNYFHHNLRFEHQSDTYYLQDRDFLKNSPKIETPISVDDGLTIYSQLQKNALIYNIFITPIDKISIWDMSPNTVPTTCNLDITDKHNFLQTYQRSAVAIYTKLQNTTMSKVPFFKQIIEHERTSQDGYKVLYGMLCICHPKLMEKGKTEPPALKTNGSLFSFIRQYTNYIECERIANRTYTDIEKLSFVMTALESDGRFEKALANLRMHKNMFEEISKTSTQAKFPPSLTVEILPYTIMKSYTTEEKHALFTDVDTTPIVRAFNNNRKNDYQERNMITNRQRIDTICRCCGINGHDVATTGCDFAASFLLTTDYLKHNPQMKQGIINNFKTYQSSKLNKNKTRKGKLSDRIKRSAQDKRIGITPTIKLFIEAIGDALEDEEPETTEDIFDISDILMEDNHKQVVNDDFHDSIDTEQPSNE